LPPYYKTWSNVSLGLKLMLSLLFAKRVTVTAPMLNQDQLYTTFCNKQASV
jgi:hypothetical protein